jgi:hypothetical protein
VAAGLLPVFLLSLLASLTGPSVGRVRRNFKGHCCCSLSALLLDAVSVRGLFSGPNDTKNELSSVVGFQNMRMQQQWVAAVTALLLMGAVPFALSDEAPKTDSVPQEARPDAVPLPGSNGDLIILDNRNQVSRRSSRGQVVWSITLDGRTGGVRAPHLLADAERVYLTHGNGVTALNVADGAILWHSQGPADRLFLSRELLLATECHIIEPTGKNARWAVARNIANGRRVFRIRLPVAGFNPNEIQEVAGLFLIQDFDAPGGKGFSLLVNRDGSIHRQLDHQILAVRSLTGGRLVLTGAAVIRLSAKGKIEWITPFPRYEWVASGDFVSVSGGGMLAFLYCGISDSGVQVLRFDPGRGTKVWDAYCEGLGISHSIYEHKAVVGLTLDVTLGDQVQVTSHGSRTFVELLDLQTGQRVKREVTDH